MSHDCIHSHPSSALTMPESSTPAVERSLNRQVILEEDEYTSALSHIIARDFFPSLIHLDATNSYLDALQSRDPHLIEASVRVLREISSTPSTVRRPAAETPFAEGPSATPLRTPINRGEGPSKRPKYDKDMSLDDFMAKYTSEDNSSFTRILDDENRKRKEKWSWAWEAQRRVEAQRERMLEGRERMMIEGAPAPGVREKLLIEAPTPAGLITSGEEEQADSKDEAAENGKGKELVLVHEQAAEDVMAPKKDTRPAGVDGWKFKVCL